MTKFRIWNTCALFCALAMLGCEGSPPSHNALYVWTQDAEGRPLEGATIYLQREGSKERTIAGTSNDLGLTRIGAIKDRRVTILADSPGLCPAGRSLQMDESVKDVGIQLLPVAGTEGPVSPECDVFLDRVK